MLFVIILDHVTCSRRMVVELQCRFQKYELYISGQIDICKLCRTQNSINFCNNGILTIFWIIPGIGIQTSSDCRAICSGCGFFFFFGFVCLFFFFPLVPALPAVSSHPFQSFSSWSINETEWTVQFLSEL